MKMQNYASLAPFLIKKMVKYGPNSMHFTKWRGKTDLTHIILPGTSESNKVEG